MKHRGGILLLCAALLLSAPLAALAQGTTYVFPYEGFRYTQKENEIVLTQTNLDEHEAFLSSLGTNRDAALASYMALGTVMEVYPEDGGQVTISVADAGDFADVMDMDKLDADRLAAFAAQYEESGMYESCEIVQTTPVCVRLTSSAMYASVPVYTLRYATLHLGRQYMITRLIVGHEPQEADDACIRDVLGGMKLLSSISDPTPSPTPVPTPTPAPTPAPTAGVAEVIASEGEIEVEGVPGFTTDPDITVTGRAEPSAAVRVAVGEHSLGKTTAKKDGTFALRVTLPEEGEQALAVMTDTAQVLLSVQYEKPMARLIVTEPVDPVFTGDNVVVRGETEPNATVYVTGKGNNKNVKAGKNGAFNLRIFINNEETLTFGLRAKASGMKENTTEITLTRKFTERESLARFREKMMSLPYDSFADDPQRYQGKTFSYRGRVMDFTDYDGSACALVCVSNPASGEWCDPVWVVLGGDEQIDVGNVVTFYLTGEGLTLPAGGEYTKSGKEVEAPVARAQFCTEIK